MSKHSHLSRLAAPASWPIKRKGTKWIAKPIPGPQKLELAMPLLVYLRDLLKLAFMRQNIKRILSKGYVLVNGKACKEVNFPVGLFDCISIPSINKNYRVVLNKLGKLGLIETSAEDAKKIILKVQGKSIIKGNKIQLSFSNGWSINTDKNDYLCGDSVLFDLEKRQVLKHFRFGRGQTAFIIQGAHVGQTGMIEGTKLEGVLKKSRMVTVSSESETWQTDAKDIFVIGEDKPEIKIA